MTRSERDPLSGAIVTNAWLLDLQTASSREQFSDRLVTVADHQAVAAGIPAITVDGDELLHFRFDGRLQHPLGSCANQFIERTGLAKLRSKLHHFRIERGRWTCDRCCRSLSHGVSSVALVGPLVKLKPNHQQDTPPFSPQTEHNNRRGGKKSPTQASRSDVRRSIKDLRRRFDSIRIFK